LERKRRGYRAKRSGKKEVGKDEGGWHSDSAIALGITVLQWGLKGPGKTRTGRAESKRTQKGRFKATMLKPERNKKLRRLCSQAQW